MIGTALNIVANSINEYLENRFSISDEVVIVSNLLDAEGKLSVSDSDKLVLSLVNVQPEKITQRGQISNKGILNVNLFVLFTSTYIDENYIEGLNYLSGIMSFFNANNVLNHSNTPDMDSSLDKLTFEIESQNLQNMSHLWGAVGAKYMPSVLYKMRMVTLKEGDFDLNVPLTGLTTRI